MLPCSQMGIMHSLSMDLMAAALLDSIMLPHSTATYRINVCGSNFCNAEWACRGVSLSVVTLECPRSSRRGACWFRRSHSCRVGHWSSSLATMTCVATRGCQARALALRMRLHAGGLQLTDI